jgi:S-adenosylmethionine hydrolase
MIVLFTDFGLSGPYVGQMKAVLYRQAPGVAVVDLFSDAPTHNPRAAAYLLAAYAGEFPEGSVFLSVVDPGVGGARRPLVVQADGRWFVGPDNGLFAITARRARTLACWAITWQPERLSASFHGRDLFAPVAARIAAGHPVPGEPVPCEACGRPDWLEDLAEVVYIDNFGNAVIGLRASTVSPDTVLSVGGVRLNRARTFSDVPEGKAFWYENANGLVELAVNRGRANEVLRLQPGDPVALLA